MNSAALKSEVKEACCGSRRGSVVDWRLNRHHESAATARHVQSNPHCPMKINENL